MRLRTINEALQKKEQLGIPAEIWKDKIIKNYEGGYGWLYNDSRTKEADEKLIETLRTKYKLDDRQIAAFICDKAGRIYGDELTRSQEAADKSLVRGVRMLTDHIKKNGYEDWE